MKRIYRTVATLFIALTFGIAGRTIYSQEAQPPANATFLNVSNLPEGIPAPPTSPAPDGKGIMIGEKELTPVGLESGPKASEDALIEKYLPAIAKALNLPRDRQLAITTDAAAVDVVQQDMQRRPDFCRPWSRYFELCAFFVCNGSRYYVDPVSGVQYDIFEPRVGIVVEELYLNGTIDGQNRSVKLTGAKMYRANETDSWRFDFGSLSGDLQSQIYQMNCTGITKTPKK